MADQIEDFSDFSDFSIGSDSEFEEETLWYMGQVSDSTLQPYQFQPRRSERQQSGEENEPSDPESDPESGDQEEPEPEEEEPVEDHGTAPVPQEWIEDPSLFCSCGHCDCSTLDHKREAVCCMDPQLNLRPIYKDQQRVCVTTDDEFDQCVLTEAVLKNALISLKNVRGDKLDVRAIPNRRFRWMGYTCFTWWIYGDRLGHKVRKIVPACANYRIRMKFPLGLGETSFTGYESASDSD